MRTNEASNEKNKMPFRLLEIGRQPAPRVSYQSFEAACRNVNVLVVD
jgi:hypothetical protein